MKKPFSIRMFYIVFHSKVKLCEHKRWSIHRVSVMSQSSVSINITIPNTFCHLVVKACKTKFCKSSTQTHLTVATAISALLQTREDLH